MANKYKMTVYAYKSGGDYFAADSKDRLWGGPARTKAELRKQLAAQNRRPLNIPRLILK